MNSIALLNILSVRFISFYVTVAIYTFLYVNASNGNSLTFVSNLYYDRVPNFDYTPFGVAPDFYPPVFA